MPIRVDPFSPAAVQGAGLLGLATWPFHPVAVADDAPDAAALAGKAVAFLRPRQGRDGSWSGEREPGITALVVTAMLRSGRVAPEDPAITKGLTFLQKYIGPKGGLSEAPHSVYTTSVALMAFHEANRGGRYDRIIKGSQEFLKTTQTDEGEGKSGSDPAYGGLGYGGPNSRPDMSNTAFFIEALRESGLAARRSGASEGADLRVAVPEPQERVQRPAAGGRGQRRRVRVQSRGWK